MDSVSHSSLVVLEYVGSLRGESEDPYRFFFFVVDLLLTIFKNLLLV